MPVYRTNVACLLRNAAGDILIAERLDFPGSWQFPQGGVKRGEALADALYREVEEELGLAQKNYRIISSRGPYRYLFPQGRRKEGYDGQEQHYFLALLTNPEATIRLDTTTPEFRDIRWISPAGYRLSWVAAMKRGVYARVLRDFFGVYAKAVKPSGILLT